MLFGTTFIWLNFMQIVFGTAKGATFLESYNLIFVFYYLVLWKYYSLEVINNKLARSISIFCSFIWLILPFRYVEICLQLFRRMTLYAILLGLWVLDSTV